MGTGFNFKRARAMKTDKQAAVAERQTLYTPWGEALQAQVESDAAVIPLAEHPHPQFARASYVSLNGWWECAFLPCGSWDGTLDSLGQYQPETFDSRILVPFSPEAPLSGLSRQLQPRELLWYSRTIDNPTVRADEQVLLHFEAVDYACAVFCNDFLVGTHQGGYLPFSFDISDYLKESSSGTSQLKICVWDPSDTGVQLRGKQKLKPGSLWHTAQSGIWQSVWYEVVSKAHLTSMKVHCDSEAQAFIFEITCSDYGKTLELSLDGQTICYEVTEEHLREDALALATLHATENALERALRVYQKKEDREAELNPAKTRKRREAGLPILKEERPTSAEPDPLEIEDLFAEYFKPLVTRLVVPIENLHYWTYDNPFLYDLTLRYGEDEVSSYCAYRYLKVATLSDIKARATKALKGYQRAFLFLNEEPILLEGVLDQGYWPDGLMTAPSDEALVHDIQFAKDSGFNIIRKNLKIEQDRWYYHCDRLGMLVWQDMVNGGGEINDKEMVIKPAYTQNAWCGTRDDKEGIQAKKLAAGSAAYKQEWQQNCLDTIDHLFNHPSIVTWSLFNEGWGQFEAYQNTKLARKADPTRSIDSTSGWFDQGCGNYESIHNFFRDIQVYEDPFYGRDSYVDRAFVLTSFGGVTYRVEDHSSSTASFGYEECASLEDWQQRVVDLVRQAKALNIKGLAGYFLMQLTDVEEETSGILTYDRKVCKLGDMQLVKFLREEVMSQY